MKKEEKWEVKKVKEITIACKGKLKLLYMKTNDGLFYTANLEELPIKMARLL